MFDSSRGDLKSHKNQFSRELRRTEIDQLINESRKRMIEESKKVASVSGSTSSAARKTSTPSSKSSADKTWASSRQI